MNVFLYLFYAMLIASISVVGIAMFRVRLAELTGSGSRRDQITTGTDQLDQWADRLWQEQLQDTDQFIEDIQLKLSPPPNPAPAPEELELHTADRRVLVGMKDEAWELMMRCKRKGHDVEYNGLGSMQTGPIMINWFCPNCERSGTFESRCHRKAQREPVARSNNRGGYSS